MARGEHSKARPQGSGLAIGGVFLTACLAALTLVTSSRGCGCTACVPAWAPGMPPREPFPGAAAAFDELGWRDAARGRPTWAAPSTPDPAAAERAVETALRERGYVEVAREDDDTPRPLPFEIRTDALEGTCGVVVVLGVTNATLTGLDDVSQGTVWASQGTVRASDPSVVTIARCGVGTVRAAGLGAAVVRTWQLPGITPADVERIGLTPETVLAHAEAEVLLRGHGLEPIDALAQQTLATRTTVTPPTHAGASGCTAWVGVIEGGGRAETSGSLGVLGRDYAIDRAMFGAASCAGPPATTTSTTVFDDVGDGFVVTWRPYGAPAAGPTRTPGASAIIATVGAARVVPLAELPPPDAIPEAAPPDVDP